MLINGPPGIIEPFLGATTKTTKSSSNIESKSVATALTDSEGDDSRLMTGKMNRSSSLRPHASLPTTYSEEANTIHFSAYQNSEEETIIRIFPQSKDYIQKNNAIMRLNADQQ